MAWHITCGVGLILLGIAALIAWREHLWLRKANFTSGTIVELIPSRSSKGRSGYTPRVEFAAHDGSRHEFVRSYSSNPAGFRVGDEVTVAYAMPTYHDRIVTFGQRFEFPSVLAAVGMGTTALSLLFILGREIVPRIYLR